MPFEAIAAQRETVKNRCPGPISRDCSKERHPCPAGDGGVNRGGLDLVASRRLHTGTLWLLNNRAPKVQLMDVEKCDLGKISHLIYRHFSLLIILDIIYTNTRA